MLRIYTNYLTAYLTAVVCAMTISGCSNKEENEPASAGKDDDTIVFNSTAIEPQSRGALSDKCNTFTLWGAKTMDGDATTGYTSHQDVIIGYKLLWQSGTAGSTTTNTQGWEYVNVITGQSVKYWDYHATSYRFFAVAPYQAYQSEKKTVGTTTYREIKVPADASAESTIYITDLWCCDEIYRYGQPVELKFKQPYSFVSFSFIDSDGNPLTLDDEGNVSISGVNAGYSLTDISFGPASSGTRVPIKGNITLGYPLEGPGKDVEIKVTDITGSLASLSYSTTPIRVLPTGEQGEYEISLVYDNNPADSVDGSEMIAPVPAEFMNWNPNMVYNYVFKITGSVVEFIRVVQVASTGWLEENGDHSIYNW